MGGSSIFKRSNSSNRKYLLDSNSRKFGEFLSFEERKIETLSVSKRLVRSFSQKFKKKKKRDDLGGFLVEERAMGRPSLSSNCISLYIKGGGCSRVGSCEEIDVNGMRKLSISEDCLPSRGAEKKNSRKMKGLERCPSRFVPPEIKELPDEVLEMILVRLSLRTLVAARLVCKKWSQMIVSSQFVQLRSECDQRNSWLFLFGLTRKGVHLGEVFALDVVEDKWHVIRNDLLKGRFLFSVASIGMDIYIIGGCTSLNPNKGAFIISPLTNSWREISHMKVARSEPVLGVFEVSANCKIFQNQDYRRDQIRPRSKTRNCGVSDVYEDPYRFSLRRQLRDALSESTNSVETRIQPSMRVGKKASNRPKFALIVVGGSGSGSEPLDSGEVYDPITDNWIEIARLPEDFGPVCSGAVCNGKFYVHSSVYNKLASYDLVRGFWVAIQTSQLPPCIGAYNPKLVSCRNRLFICGVCWSEEDMPVNRPEQVMRKLWELDTATHSWTEATRHPDAPMDKHATFAADGERIYGVDMFRVFGQALDFVTACHVSDTGIEWRRASRKHAGHEACKYSCMSKSMVVLHL